MGHKVHPKIFRVSTIGSWDSRWFSKRNYIEFLQEDVQIRRFLKKKLREAAVDKIVIDRSRQSMTITVFTAKPGFIIGRAGSGIDDLKKELQKMFFRGRRVALNINVQDIGQGSLSAAAVAEQIAMDLERRMPFRRVLKQTLDRVIKSGAKGARIIVAGRLNGADIARTERVSQGTVPLQNLRADIRYAHAEANTTFGVIGVKVWIYLGEVFGQIDETKPLGDVQRTDRDGRGRRDGRDRRGPRPPRRDSRNA